MKTIIRTNWTDGKGNLLFWSEQENLNPGLARCFTPDGVELKGTPAENLEVKTPTLEFFTVILVSSNTNSFGLKSILLLHEDGRGKQILKSPYGGDKLPEEGDRIEFRGGRFQCGFYECPSDLPTIPADKAAKILKTVRRAKK